MPPAPDVMKRVRACSQLDIRAEFSFRGRHWRQSFQYNFIDLRQVVLKPLWYLHVIRACHEMGMKNRFRRSSVPIIIFLAVSGAAQSQTGDAACSMERMERDARSVVVPCSAVLESAELSPEQRGMALFIRGRGYHRSGQIPLAAIDYDQALRLIPDNEELWMSRSNVFFRLHEPVQGARYLAQAYRLNPSNPHVLFQMGLRAANAGSPYAFTYFSRALEIDPAEPYSLQFRARLLFSAKQFDAAFKDIDTLVALAPEVINRTGYLDADGRMRDFHIVARSERADMLAELAKYDLAEQELNAAVAYKRSAESLTARGNFLSRRPGRAAAALTDLEEATALDRSYRPAFDSKGFCPDPA
jgi:Flp pilus assembly protein TadD